MIAGNFVKLVRNVFCNFAPQDMRKIKILKGSNPYAILAFKSTTSHTDSRGVVRIGR